MRWQLVSAAMVLALGAAHPGGARAADAPKARIVYSRAEGEKVTLHVMNADGTDDHALPGVTTQINLFPTWSPDGKQIAFAGGAKGGGTDVYVVNADGTGLAKLPGAAEMNAMPAWSPDGKRLAFGTKEGVVYVCQADGSERRRVSADNAMCYFPFWTSDGKSVGFTLVSGEDTGEVALAPADGGEAKKITDSGLIAVVGANGVSPDGKWLAYLAVGHGKKEATLRTFGLGEKVENTLLSLDLSYVDEPPTAPTPAWFPDGKSLLIPVTEGKHHGLYRVTEDGQKTRLTPEDVDCFSAAIYAPK